MSTETKVPPVVVEEAIRLMNDYAYAAEADAGFDGGEFSGPANARSLERALAKLADRHGVTVDDVREAVDYELAGQEEA